MTEKDDLVERATARALINGLHYLAELFPQHSEIGEAITEIERLRAKLASMRDALTECEEVLGLVEYPKIVDPLYGDEVEALGHRIGFGALMGSASASWRAALAEMGCPVGGEFVAGPCQKTVERTLVIIRTALNTSPGSAGTIEPVAWAEKIGGKIVSVRLDKSIHCTVPLYIALTSHSEGQP